MSSLPSDQHEIATGNDSFLSFSPLAAPEFMVQVLRAITQPFAVANRAGRFLLCNSSFEQLAGYSSPELSKISPASLFATANPKADQAEMVQVLETGGSRSGITRWRSRTGHEIPVEVRCTRLELPDGEPLLLGRPNSAGSPRRDPPQERRPAGL